MPSNYFKTSSIMARAKQMVREAKWNLAELEAARLKDAKGKGQRGGRSGSSSERTGQVSSLKSSFTTPLEMTLTTPYRTCVQGTSKVKKSKFG